MSKPTTQTVIGNPAYDPSEASRYKVIRRNNAMVNFDASKIHIAMTKAFLAVEGGSGAASARVRDLVSRLTEQVIEALKRRQPGGGTFHIEDIQDQVELALMRAGEHEVARAYVLYREERARERRQQAAEETPADVPVIQVSYPNGSRRVLDMVRLRAVIEEACSGLGTAVSIDAILGNTVKNLYDGISEDELFQAPILASRVLIERDPAYAYVSARLLLDRVRWEVLGEAATQAEMTARYPQYFRDYLQTGIQNELIDPRLGQYDLERITAALRPERDLDFQYLGMQILYDRYFLHVRERRIELPQAFWMRVAMGLAMNEVDRETHAIAFYEVLSSFDFVSSTPTLFNAGTLRPQLSSCFLTTVGDDLDDIYEAIKENAMLSKFSGGLGNDWTPVRALGSFIKGTNGKSQGVVPFLKVVNDTAVAVNQGGKRKGAVCAYLETWHMDIEEFLELRKNTGDDRRRTHDMNTANWIPDLFMERVESNAMWTLFSPNETPDLHDLTGAAFRERYEHYEHMADAGTIGLFKRIPAVHLWRKMLTMLFETGHPWITFKDPCNLRSPQQHVGVVHSSNLCTEITLNTNAKEIAVCNLGSVNLVAHLRAVADADSGALRENSAPEELLAMMDGEKLHHTIRVAMRMLDNVIDMNYYAVAKARNSNLRHRPVGLGLMGFSDALLQMRIPYASAAALAFADISQEVISYHAIDASADLARERGSYQSFPGSLWSQGILPIDSIERLAASREHGVDVDRSQHLDWATLRGKVQGGMRNSNCLAIAPTATISNIVGVSQGIEPIYQNLYVKSNLSGEFTVVNSYLVHDLKRLELWDEVMVNDLKYFDGSVMPVDRIPASIKPLYANAFEIDPEWLVEAAARRQKWLDQAQSLNLYFGQPSGKKIDEIYRLAWKRGLKTTYYLRSLSATAAEKSTVQTGTLNAVVSGQPKACAIDDPTCEACQ
ncbi:ribonucleoside-diphosphate reductase subunit alpha [Acidithiobacillus sp. 'AMD consortium']|uniref:Ribonucleoside-diphosphate reductase n=2 Tax=Acidithiobacillus ferridurans TaxID=1232575 RepID=A0A8X8GAD6_ACIFI|nr:MULTISPECIES: ribonucleoside-diphosphate reductase subunit alpha [Acidithiobacillus]MBU2715736.1 ribonucleoside-diphosphate reductase subunit alpha [Acidithiobacillus ferridurans]MBU2722749.1 ribonucleoside-diphosphate reductase subunit alpha [Acidithiobacillus ferridurans]MBU2727867.1 ribonucleoside-diphosphate reductase subunit alpha [Acidithiobacillus ferridurans]QFG79313.1 ribonucleoside-diphosphate reductase subunit alpha [Acidithiobacillus sp. 'AMD consortium']BBF64376.1 Ribonucleosid